MSPSPRRLPDSGLRFIGYLNRRPYLWSVDLLSGAIEPAAADLKSIPQAIDDVVPMPDSVGVRCGPRCYHLNSDLSGKLELMDATDQHLMEARSRQVAIGWSDGSGQAILLNDREVPVADDRVGQWRMAGTLSPDGKVVALGATTVEATAASDDHYVRHSELAQILSMPTPASPSLLFLIDVDSGQSMACEGSFENFCTPPAWSASGDWVAFCAPFHPKHLFLAHRQGGPLHPVRFRRHAPSPLVDRLLLPGIGD